MKKIKKTFKKVLTNENDCDIIIHVASEKRLANGKISSQHGSIAQLGEHLPYKQRVIGSSPIVSTSDKVMADTSYPP